VKTKGVTSAKKLTNATKMGFFEKYRPSPGTPAQSTISTKRFETQSQDKVREVWKKTKKGRLTLMQLNTRLPPKMQYVNNIFKIENGRARRSTGFPPWIRIKSNPKATELQNEARMKGVCPKCNMWKMEIT